MTGPDRPIGRALAAPRRGALSFVRGLAFPFQGARLVYLEHPGLIRYWIVPILVTLLALVGSIAAVVTYHDALTAWVWSTPEGDGLGADLARAMHWLFDVLVVLLLSLAALASALLVSGVVAAPFNGRLAEVLDEKVTRRPPSPFSLRRAVFDALRQAVIEVVFFVVNAVLLVTSLLAPALSPLTGALGLVFASLYFGISYLEAPLASRGRGLADRWRLVTQHPMALLGFGTGVGLFLFVPFVNLLFMPAAVAGGVLFHASVEDEGRDTVRA